MGNKPKRYKPHELAPHVAAMIRMLPHNDMRPVDMAMECAISHLQAVAPTELDLADPDNGIPHALRIERENHSPKAQAAAVLLRMCLHARERGETIENERAFLPLQLAALSGFEPDEQSRRASNKRNRGDALDRGLDDALVMRPEAEWTGLADWLEGEGVVLQWGTDFLTFTDGDDAKEISIGTFLNRITAARNRRK